MNLSFYILDYLKTNTKTNVSGLGIFNLKNTSAEISKDQSILPPAKEIVFISDYETRDDGFILFLSKKENISEFEAELELKKFTNYCKNKLDKHEELELSELGIFRNVGDDVVFKGKKIDDLTPDFYGLEEIKFSEIKNRDSQVSVSNEVEEGNYQFNKSILWAFLVIIPIAGIAILAFTKKEMLFGNNSDLNVKTATHRIEKNKTPIDSLSQLKKDSLKGDSLKTAIPTKSSNKTSQSK